MPTFRARKEILHDNKIRFITLGLVACTISFAILALGNLSTQGPMAYILFGFFLMSLISVVYAEKRASEKLMNYHLFTYPSFAIPMIGSFCLGACYVMAMILPPIYLQSIHHFSTWHVGLLCFSLPLGSTLTAKISSKLAQRLSTQTTMLMGFSIMAASMLALAIATTNWPISFFITLLFTLGLGAGAYQAPSYQYIASQVAPHKQSNIAALIRMTQNMGMTFTAACVSLIIVLNKHVLINSIVEAWLLASSIAIMISFALLYLKLSKQVTR